MRQYFPFALLLVGFFNLPTLRAETEELPPPRLVERHVAVELLPGGYRVTLSRKAAERLSAGLAGVGDGKQFTDLAKGIVSDLNDPGADAKLEMISWVVKTQSPALKKALDEKMDGEGAIVRVYGVEKKKLPERPVLKALVGTFIPDDMREQLNATRTIFNMTPLYWKVEGRK